MRGVSTVPSCASPSCIDRPGSSHLGRQSEASWLQGHACAPCPSSTATFAPGVHEQRVSERQHDHERHIDSVTTVTHPVAWLHTFLDFPSAMPPRVAAAISQVSATRPTLQPQTDAHSGRSRCRTRQAGRVTVEALGGSGNAFTAVPASQTPWQPSKREQSSGSKSSKLEKPPTELIFNLYNRGSGWGEEFIPHLTVQQRAVVKKPRRAWQVRGRVQHPFDQAAIQNATIAVVWLLCIGMWRPIWLHKRSCLSTLLTRRGHCAGREHRSAHSRFGRR